MTGIAVTANNLTGTAVTANTTKAMSGYEVYANSTVQLGSTLSVESSLNTSTRRCLAIDGQALQTIHDAHSGLPLEVALVASVAEAVVNAIATSACATALQLLLASSMCGDGMSTSPGSRPTLRLCQAIDLPRQDFQALQSATVS